LEILFVADFTTLVAPEEDFVAAVEAGGSAVDEGLDGASHALGDAVDGTEVDADVVCLEFHRLIFNLTLGIELRFALIDVEGDGVGGFVMDDGGDGILGERDELEGVGHWGSRGVGKLR
jgi:hypothetical protein